MGVARYFAGATALGAAGLGYGGLIERNAFVVRRRIVPVLDPGSAPVRVLHVSDLLAGRDGSLLRTAR